MKFILLSFFYLLIFSAFSQGKYEKEKRIRKSKAPTDAVRFIDYFTDEKVKWFFEEGSEGLSYEAKFELEEHNYSIEFDTSGRVKDVEILIHLDEIEEITKDSVIGCFSYNFSEYRIQKIQIQYVGSEDQLKLLKRSQGAYFGQYSIVYEILVKGKNEGITKLYEFQFNQQGTVIRKQEVIFRNSDNLEY